MRRVPAFGPVCALALLGGIGICLLLPSLPSLPWWPIFAVVLAVGIWLWCRYADSRRIVGIALLGFGLAGMHASVALARQLPASLEGRTLAVAGTVVDLPAVEARRTRFRFRVDGDVRDAALRGRLLQLAWYDPFGSDQPGARMRVRAGQHWSFVVRLRAPRGLRNPGGFDSEKYALAQRLAAGGYVTEPERARLLAPAAGLDAWRDAMSRRIAVAVLMPSSRFVRALALGDTNDLDDEDWDVLRADGLTHLIAISGFHVALVAGLFALCAKSLWWLLPSLGRRVPRVQAAGIAAVAGAVLYAGVAGFALPTVRTVLMIAVLVAARLWRRQAGTWQSLALAAMAMLLVDPLAPLAPGFWLSFVGVGWLLWCLPERQRNPLRALLGAQGVATFGLLPLTVVLFGQASLVGPLANLIAVPWWSLVVVPLALLGTAFDAVHAGAGGWLWMLSARAFDLLWPVFDGMAHSPVALAWLPQARWYALPLALIGAFWLLLPRDVAGKPLAPLLWLPLLWPPLDVPKPGDVALEVVDVGQGLSVLVRTAHHALLYDMGPAAQDGFDAGERAVVPTLHALGVRRLDGAIVSHGDNDHAGGLPSVRAAYRLPFVLSAPDGPVPDTTPCIAGTHWRWDGVEFVLLHPPRYFPYLDNDSSCVLQVRAIHGTALLPGDIDAVVERELVRAQGAALRSDVVLMSHHGSAGSSDPAFVAATRARVAVVSAGYGNRFGHPRAAVVARWREAGTQVPETLEAGALRIRITAEGVAVDGERKLRRRFWDAAVRASHVSQTSQTSGR